METTRDDVLGLVDGSGRAVAAYRYDAWGNILEAAGPLADANPYRYAGYRWDEEIGLYFVKTRYYDPALGRFISRDTVLGAPKNPQTLNTYQYGLNNPIRYIDPDGRWVVQAAAAIVGSALGAYAGYRLAQAQGWGTAGTVLATVGGAALGGALGFVYGPGIIANGSKVAWRRYYYDENPSIVGCGGRYFAHSKICRWFWYN